MRIRTLSGLNLIALLAVVPSALSDEKVDAVEKEIANKWKDVKSMTADMTMDSEFNQGSMSMKGTMKSKVEYLRHDGKMLSRMEGENEVVRKMGEKEQTLTMKIVAVSDGEITQTLREQMGQTICIKAKADAQATVGEAMFRALREEYDLTVADDAEVDGEKCWVIEARPKQTTPPGAPNMIAFYIRQKDGATAQMLGYDASDKKIMTASFGNIKFGQELDPKHFELEIPEGVQVMDMTKKPEPPKAP
jgi:outer membrane lipoprotein-sorting protein